MPRKKKIEKIKLSRGSKIFLVILGVLIVIRLLLPAVVLRFANNALASMHGYYGHIEDVDISLLRGAYVINNIYINKIDSLTDQQVAFFRSDAVDLSVEWKALLHGAFVGELEFIKPTLRFTKDKAEPGQVKNDSSDFRILLDKLMPLKINRFVVNHGVLAYRDSSAKPPVALDMTETYIVAENLKNSYEKADVLPASVKATANLYQGHLNVGMKLNPMAASPTFDLNAGLNNTNLPELNEFFKAYGKFDVSGGDFGLYSEMAAADGKFKGYVKPVIKDLKVIGPEDRHDAFLHQVWEHMVGAAGVVFRNQEKKQVATKVPIEGDFNHPHTGLLDAVVEVLKNAFVQALIPSIDHEINLSSVKSRSDEKNFFQKLFEKKKDNGKKLNA